MLTGRSKFAMGILHCAVAAVLWPIAIVTTVTAWSQREDNNTSSDVFRACSLVSVTASMVHASALLSHAFTIRPIFYMYRKYAHRALTGAIAAACTAAFWFAWFDRVLCQGDSGMCKSLAGVFASYMLFMVAMMVLQVCALVLFAYTYATQRYHNWKRIWELEDLLGFHESLVIGESCQDVQRFCEYWIRISPDEIIKSISSGANTIMSAMVNDMDLDNSRSISMNEFVAFSAKHNRHDTHKTQEVWRMLSDPDEDSINANAIQRALYDLAFYRRRLAHLLLTDMLVVDWAMSFIQGICYSACVIVSLSIYGYDAFGNGLDLLKVYLGLLTYVLSSMGPTINFVVTMVVHRPFNIGDVLMLSSTQSSTGAGVGSSLFRVDRMSLGYTSLVGTHALQIQNRTLISNCPIVNMSRIPMNDTMVITVPSTTCASFVDRVHAAILKYASVYPCEIDKHVRIKVVWNELMPNSKRLEVRWTYLPTIHDHSHAKSMMYNARNMVHHAIWRELREDSLALGSAQGGAFNAALQYTLEKMD